VRTKRPLLPHNGISVEPETNNDLQKPTVEETNPLTPNDHYSGRAAPLTSKRCILYIYSTNIGTE